MKKLITALLSAGLLLAGAVQAEAELDNPGGIGGVESLRGASELEATRAADDFKKFLVTKYLRVTMYTNHL